jgi:hypothetical protein
MMETKIIHCIQNIECRTELGQSIGVSAEEIFAMFGHISMPGQSTTCLYINFSLTSMAQ